MAVWDVGLWLDLHVLPMSASSHLTMAFGVLGMRHLWYRICHFNTGSPQRGWKWGDRAAQMQDLGPLKGRI